MNYWKDLNWYKTKLYKLYSDDMHWKIYHCKIKKKKKSMTKYYVFHPFHLVTPSPWPIIVSFNMLSLALSGIGIFHCHLSKMFFISFILLILCLIQWWRDVTREGSLQGSHSISVINGFKWGFSFFIISEVFFFIAFFWSYFHMMLAPSPEIGLVWPPYYMSLLIINPYFIPLLNTIILVSSGIFLSSSHLNLILKKYKKANAWMMLTIILGILFSGIQAYEYDEAIFQINMSCYGSVFFLLTGFHGLHVIIGTIFLIVNFKRFKKKMLTKFNHFSFEASAWYWHFVDVVWLFLFLTIYWLPF